MTSELKIEPKTELDTTEFKLTETLEIWLELLELTIELEKLDNSVLDTEVCEFCLVKLKIIALPDTTKIEVIIAKMILSLFDIELVKNFGFFVIYPFLCQHSQTYTQKCFESKDLLLNKKWLV